MAGKQAFVHRFRRNQTAAYRRIKASGTRPAAHGPGGRHSARAGSETARRSPHPERIRSGRGRHVAGLPRRRSGQDRNGSGRRGQELNRGASAKKAALTGAGVVGQLSRCIGIVAARPRSGHFHIHARLRRASIPAGHRAEAIEWYSDAEQHDEHQILDMHIKRWLVPFPGNHNCLQCIVDARRSLNLSYDKSGTRKFPRYA